VSTLTPKRLWPRHFPKSSICHSTIRIL
jgi:hypothetical protein